MESLPDDLRAALDGGDADAVAKLMPPNLPKNLQKKMLKHAQTNAQRIAQNKSIVPINAKILGQQDAAPPQTKKASTDSSAANRDCSVQLACVVDDVLEFVAQSPGLSPELIDALMARRPDLKLALEPRLNALRNLAYAEGIAAVRAK